MSEEDIGSAAEQLRSGLETLFGARETTIESMRNLQALSRVAIAAEASRLERRFGPEHPRTVAMKSRLTANQSLTRALQVEAGVVSVRPVVKGQDEVVIEGRVRNARGIGLDGLIVRLSNLRGEAVVEAGQTSTAKGGYFSLKLTEDILRRIRESNPRGVLIGIFTEKNERIHLTQDLFTPAPGLPLAEIVLPRESRPPVVAPVREQPQQPERKAGGEEKPPPAPPEKQPDLKTPPAKRTGGTAQKKK